jgi:hypothetical protein
VWARKPYSPRSSSRQPGGLPTPAAAAPSLPEEGVSLHQRTPHSTGSTALNICGGAGSHGTAEEHTGPGTCELTVHLFGACGSGRHGGGGTSVVSAIGWAGCSSLRQYAW